MTTHHHPNTFRREWLVFYYKNRGTLWSAFWAPLLLATLVSFVPVPRYKAHSVLIVRLGSEYVYQTEVAGDRNGQPLAIPFDRQQIFKSEVAILGSDDLHEQVIRTIGLERIYPELLGPNLLDLVTVKLNRINFGSGEAIAAPLRNTLNEKKGKNPGEALTQEQLAQAVHVFGKRLDLLLEKDSAVINLSFEHKDPTVAATVLDTLLKFYMDKRRQLYKEPRVELAASQAEDARQRMLAATQATEDFKREHKIYALNDQRSALIQSRAEVDRQMASVSSPALSSKLLFFNRQLDALDAMERELTHRQHEAKIAEDEYAFFAHKLAEARAFEDLQREREGGVRVIQAPSVEAEPKNLQPFIILAGFIMAVFSAMLTAAWVEFFGSGFSTPEKLERHIGLPVLAALPFEKRMQRR